MTKFSARMRERMEAYASFGVALSLYCMADDLVNFGKKKRFWWEGYFVDYLHTLLLVSIVAVYYSLFKLSGMLNL